MKTGMNIPSCDMLKGDASLQEETTVRDFNLESLIIPQPRIKPRISRFPMDSQKADVIMETGENGIKAIFI